MLKVYDLENGGIIPWYFNMVLIFTFSRSKALAIKLEFRSSEKLT